MRPASVLRSGAFRLATIFAVIFAAGATLLAVGFNAAVRIYADNATFQSLTNEVAVVRRQAGTSSRAGLQAFIQRREQTLQAEHFRYLLLSADGRTLAGSLPTAVARLGPARTTAPDPPEADERGDETEGGAPDISSIRTFGFRLGDGSVVVVGRDAFAMDDLTRWVNLLTLWTGSGVVLLALIGGYVLASLFVGRLERVNAAAERIMAGHLEERLPTIGPGNEFHRLSIALNTMLDRIEELMGNLRQVSADIAHDMRTPLTRLRATLESVPAGASAEDCGRARDDALAQLDLAIAVFSALLSIAQIESGGGRARFTPVDLSELLGRIVDAYRPAAEDVGAKINGVIEPGVTIRGDPDLMGQLFANLIENALNHAGPAAMVEVALAGKQAGEFVASVSDSGRGIPEAERGQVLRRFYRLEASRSTPGAGLGLAMGAAIADMHELKLKLLDNDPGLRVEISGTRV